MVPVLTGSDWDGVAYFGEVSGCRPAFWCLDPEAVPAEDEVADAEALEEVVVAPAAEEVPDVVPELLEALDPQLEASV
jgi:hypothetical protein